MPRALKPGSKAHMRKALSRLQGLVGTARSTAADDRDPNRQAHLQSILKEAWEVALAGNNALPLPEPRDHSRAH